MELSYVVEQWPIAGQFKISRHTLSEATTLTVTLTAQGKSGRGECEIHEADNEAIERTVATLEQLRPSIEAGITRTTLATLLPPCPERNALDCALWDLESKHSGKPVWQLAGLQAPKALGTAYTISVDDPAVMAQQATQKASFPLLKVKLKGDGDLERLAAVRDGAPASRLIVDANEAWSLAQLEQFAPAMQELGVALIEQPLPRDADEALIDYAGPIPLCADESCRDTASLKRLQGRYQFINIKLDKSGGLTEALALLDAAKALDFGIMVGCMVGTSLAMAPAFLLAQQAAFVDLDGPLLLQHDRTPGIRYERGLMQPFGSALWG